MPDSFPTTFKKVTMRAVSLAPDGTFLNHDAVDYVGADLVDAYVTDAQTRWQAVTVADDDRTPAAIDATDYTVPTHLDTTGA